VLELTGAADAFDRYLDPDARQPLAVACSGGGDSVAALLAAKAWADAVGRRVVVLHVDHGLQAQSRAWRGAVADLAARIGCEFRCFEWRGEKPARGLAAAARRARHALIADAARACGARVVIFGHTLDDLMEAELMRAEGSTLGRLLAWSPSPAWPEARGIFLLRPLIDSRRAEIRRALSAAGETWIEDPANDDACSPRARARRRLEAGEGPCALPKPEPRGEAALARAARIDRFGAVRFGRDLLRGAPRAAARHFLGAAALCVGGGARPPRRRRIEALLERLLAPGEVAATLAGARISADEEVFLARDSGEIARGGLAPIAIARGAPVVWDGRFELETVLDGVEVSALKGRAAALGEAERGALREVPAMVRGALPIARGAGAAPICPILAEDGRVRSRFLGGERLLAACGAILKEPRD
jgi:tRNA(Ile)-lysidine synthase